MRSVRGRTFVAAFTIVAAVFVISSAASSTGAARRSRAVAHVNAAGAQTIEGFGASGAWWPIDLVHFPRAVQQQVARMLFSPTGIALSGYRYNIGGGGVGVTTPDRAPAQFAHDDAGRLFLRFAHDAHVPILTGFVNSAPPQFTTNGKACGGSLKRGMESAYAAYLASVVRALRDQDGVSLQYVSPMNEPDNAFSDCGQEGMQVPVEQRATVVQALARALAIDAPQTRVIADETTADVILANEAPRWLSVPGTTDAVAAIAHHTYDFPNDALRALLPPLSARFGRPTWMTEICCYKGSGGVASSFGPNYDPTMKQGFWLADQIEADLTVAGDTAWYWWTALSPELGCDPKADPTCPTVVNGKGFNDGLLYYDEHGTAGGVTRIFTTKRFFVLGQFSRYVRPGAVRHAVDGLPVGVHAMAFATGSEWTVVSWNENSFPSTFELDLPSHARALVTRVMTNDLRDLATAPRPARTKSGGLVLKLPARTIVTYTFRA